MNKIITWLGAGTMAAMVWACGGKVVVEGDGTGEGGAGGLGQGGGTTTGPNPLTCGDMPLPSPADLSFCGGSVVSAGSGGMTSCETDLCDSSGNTFAALCSGAACECIVNGITKCSCATTGVTDFCSDTPCCPWIPIGI
jgi:hypothetical protein